MECGTPISSDRLCQKCGAVMDTMARFCRKCGAPMKDYPGAGLSATLEPTESETASKERKCRLCGAKVPEAVQYCPSCGTNQDILEGKVDLRQAAKVELESDPAVPREDLDACPACGTEARGSGRFCYACGRFIGSDIEDVICPKCGSTSSLRYLRCQYCGAEIPSVTKKTQ
jgi:RNA polymerase subunit RPABC4/transcription elongation factor Spt4